MGRFKVRRTSGAIVRFLVVVVATILLTVPAAHARKLYTANKSVDTVAAVEVEDGAATGPVTHTPIGTRPGAVAITPDGKQVFAASGGALNDPDPDYVYVLDVPSGKVSQVEVGDRPYSLAVSPSGDKLYVTNIGTTKWISVVDTSSKKVTTALEGQVAAVGEVAVHPDGSRVYVAVRDADLHKIWVLSSATNEVEDKIDLPLSASGNKMMPIDIGFTPDGNTMIVTYLTDWVIEDNKYMFKGGAWYLGANRGGDKYHEIEDTLSTGDRVSSSHIAVTPDGSRTYIANTRVAFDEIYVLDNSSRELIAGPFGDGNNAVINGPWYMAMSPSGAFAVAGNASGDANFVSVIDTDPASGKYNKVIAPISIPHPNPGMPTLPTMPIGVAFTPNQSPVGALSVDVGTAGEATVLDASTSLDPDGFITKYHWQFEDDDSATTTSPVTEHTYTSPGSYTASVTVEDNEGSKGKLVFTGKTAMHAAGPANASTSFEVEVADDVSEGPAPDDTAPDDTAPNSGSEDNPQGKSSARPKLKVLYPRKGARYRKKKLRSFKGTAKGGNKIKVRYSLAIKAGKKCRLLTAKGKARQHKLGSCRSSAFKRAKGSNRWSVKLGSYLRPGKYILTIKASNAEGRGSVKRVEFSVV